ASSSDPPERFGHPAPAGVSPSGGRQQCRSPDAFQGTPFMLLHIPGVLSQAEVTHCRVTLENAAWIDGNATAGEQAALAKHNLQIPEDSETARALGDIILRALGRSALFTSAALPLRVLPPMFNRYDTGMKFADHVDGAVRGMGPSGLR